MLNGRKWSGKLAATFCQWSLIVGCVVVCERVSGNTILLPFSSLPNFEQPLSVEMQGYEKVAKWQVVYITLFCICPLLDMPLMELMRSYFSPTPMLSHVRWKQLKKSQLREQTTIKVIFVPRMHVALSPDSLVYSHHSIYFSCLLSSCFK
jgi:hypothetical protein